MVPWDEPEVPKALLLKVAHYSGALSASVQLTVGNAPIPFVSNSLSKQIATKLERGTIRNVKDALLTNRQTFVFHSQFLPFAERYYPTNPQPQQSVPERLKSQDKQIRKR